jgi:hypothetical protein
LIASNRAGKTKKRARDILLVGPALLHEIYHRIRFRQVVPRLVLRDGDAAHNHDTVVALGFNQAAVINAPRDPFDAVPPAILQNVPHHQKYSS